MDTETNEGTKKEIRYRTKTYHRHSGDAIYGLGLIGAAKSSLGRRQLSGWAY